MLGSQLSFCLCLQQLPKNLTVLDKNSNTDEELFKSKEGLDIKKLNVRNLL